MTPYHDFELFAPAFLKIKDEKGNIVPFEFNTAQRKVLKKIKDFYKVERITLDLVMRPDFALRLIILKARQQGISTLVQAFIFWALYLIPNQKCLTLGHKIDASNNLFEMYKRYYEQIPKELKRKIQQSNEKKVQYLISKSENKIDTAGAGEIGRSDTLQFIHATEVAFYQDQKTTFVGLMQGAKYAKAHFIESTANGYNLFRDKWVDAVEGKSQYVPIFLSWLEFPEYVENARRLGVLSETIDIGNVLYNAYEGEEQLLKDKYKATDDQLKWRRWAITNLCEGDIDKFHQEYPRDPEEAFISSGNPVLPQAQVHANFANSKAPLKIGDLIFTDRESQKVEFVENARGFIKIWTEPTKKDGHYRFAAGVDVAEGLAQGDFSEVRVYDRVDSNIHLTWHGHIDPDLLGEEIFKIWLYLNRDCHFAIEKNNHGLTTLVKAFELGVSLYSKESFSKGYEQRSGSDFGHVTSMKTKKILVDTLIQWVRESLFTDYDKEFWKQAMTFVRNARGQTQAEGKDKDPSVKNFDDMIIAEGLALICHNWMPSFTEKIKREAVSRSYITNRFKPVGKTKF